MMNADTNTRNGNAKTQPVLKLPDLIDKLAKEGDVIKWDTEKKWFEVIDAKGFECKFNALRCIRGKRKENTADRPFARMHIHFALVRGEKWAGMGSAFRPKSVVCPSIQELLLQDHDSPLIQSQIFRDDHILMSSFEAATKRLKSAELALRNSQQAVRDQIYGQPQQFEGADLLQVISLFRIWVAINSK